MSNEKNILQVLAKEGNCRKLLDVETSGSVIRFEGREFLNLSSNDYLGISERVDLQEEFFGSLNKNHFLMSSSSSRLMCGNGLEYSQLERFIAQIYNTEEALMVGSGYLLNSSILRAICESDDVVLADKLIHASFVDGLMLAPCKWERFRHNDVQELEKLLVKHQGKKIFVVIESVYSMDGDIAPIDEILKLKDKYGFVLVADEAHAFGVFGKHGEGVIEVGQDVDYRIVTLGKAAASTGAFVVCSKERKALMVNRLKSLIYSTALPPINLLWTRFILEKIYFMDAQRSNLWRLINKMGAQSQIVPIPCSGNDNVLQLVDKLRDKGFWTTAIRSPTVRKGEERIRISLTANLKIEQLNKLCELIG